VRGDNEIREYGLARRGDNQSPIETEWVGVGFSGRYENF